MAALRTPKGLRLFWPGAEDKLLGFFNLGYVKASALPGKRGLVQDKVRWVAE